MTGGRLLNAQIAAGTFTGVTIDSRSVQPGQLFVAIRGERHDGHDYIEQAVAAGAAGVLSEAANPKADAVSGRVAVVSVPDTHRAMMALARQYRAEFVSEFVGITGSNGKTTTKELTFALLSAVEQEVYRSPGNFNNLFGMPLAIFSMPSAAKVAVMEMGISKPGEMTELADIVKPTVVVVTNVGP
jgi:UDP-N-acetylmuramoyl-tripeptide--D-alanyl-D-alanine ligase